MSAWTAILVVLLTFIAALIACALSSTRIRLRAAYDSGGLTYEATVRLPLVPWEISLSKLIRRFARRARKRDANCADGKGDRNREDAGGNGAPQKPAKKPDGPGLTSAIASVKRAYHAFSSLRPEIAEAISKMARSVTVNRLDARATLGVDDAAATALLVGAARAAAGAGTSMLRKAGVRFQRRPRFDIRAEFNAAVLRGDVSLTVTVVPFPVFTSSLRLYRAYRKAREVKKPPKRHNIPLKRNSAA